jgi:signal transduction histidine kinase
MQRLAVAFTRQRRFVADAAHELRTPVTVLRLQLQLLERAADPAARAAAVAELRGGIQRSQRLIEQLLALSRTEPEVDDTRLERIDLADVVRDSVRHRAAQAERRDIDLAATGSGECVVAGDREQLAVLLGNLLDNALQHTPAGSAVRVSAAPVDGRPALAVVDDGPGIAEAERSRVFDRFYRIRTAGDNGAADREMGSGLGLAIVQAIAQRHGAVVSLHTAAAGRGLEVRVAFPAPPAAA